MAAEQLVTGARAIADHLGLRRRVVYDLVASDSLPVFRLGQRIVASPTALREWRERQLADAERKVARGQERAA